MQFDCLNTCAKVNSLRETVVVWAFRISSGDRTVWSRNMDWMIILMISTDGQHFTNSGLKLSMDLRWITNLLASNFTLLPPQCLSWWILPLTDLLLKGATSLCVSLILCPCSRSDDWCWQLARVQKGKLAWEEALRDTESSRWVAEYQTYLSKKNGVFYF